MNVNKGILKCQPFLHRVYNPPSPPWCTDVHYVVKIEYFLFYFFCSTNGKFSTQIALLYEILGASQGVFDFLKPKLL